MYSDLIGYFSILIPFTISIKVFLESSTYKINQKDNNIELIINAIEIKIRNDVVFVFFKTNPIMKNNRPIKKRNGIYLIHNTLILIILFENFKLIKEIKMQTIEKLETNTPKTILKIANFGILKL